jgi:hypothetical protein
MIDPNAVEVSIRDGLEPLRTLLLTRKGLQAYWLASAEPGQLLKPSAQNLYDGLVHVEMRIDRIGAPYTLELRQGERLTVNAKQLQREMGSQQLVYDFMVWALDMNYHIPVGLRISGRALVACHTIFVVSPDRYHYLLSGPEYPKETQEGSGDGAAQGEQTPTAS